MAYSTKVFRDTFKLIDKELLHWFPGHMGKGVKDMQRKLINVDCVIEVHDARIPFSGRNPMFKTSICAVRPHILVLNKKDLVDASQNSKVLERLKNEQKIEHVIYTNCKDDRCQGVKSVFPLMLDIINSSDRFHRNLVKELSIMVIGVPNVGKSSFLNKLRNRHLQKPSAAAVGAQAGITRSVMNRIKISEEPPVYILDTPGILSPSITNIEEGLKLALCSCLLDHLVGEDIIADYLLYWLNKHKRFQYVKLMGLDEPTDHISVVLTTGAVHLNKYMKKRTTEGSLKMYPDFLHAARYMIDAFRSGKLGKIFLDRDILSNIDE